MEIFILLTFLSIRIKTIFKLTVFEDIIKLNIEEFQRTVGVSADIFSSICRTVAEVIKKGKDENPMRKRGKQTGISVENQVLIFFYYIRDYPTFLKLGQQFKISESYTHRNLSSSVKHHCATF